jgi:hypothetical protein
MAFEAQQIFPIDFNKSAAVGVDLPFSAPGVFKSNFTTKEAIKSNLINYFLTNPGERPLNPTFGAGLRDFVFEQIIDENLDFLQEKISADMQVFFPNVNILNLEVYSNTSNNSISISLNYNIINTNISDTIEIDFT